MGFFRFLAILGMIGGGVLWHQHGLSFLFFIALGFFILTFVAMSDRLFALAVFVLGVVAWIYLLVTHNYVVYMILIGIAGFLKACRFIADQGENLEVYDKYVFEEWIYRKLNEHDTKIVQFLCIVPCVLFYLLLGYPAFEMEILGFLPALFLLYRFIRIVQTTDDWGDFPD